MIISSERGSYSIVFSKFIEEIQDDIAQFMSQYSQVVVITDDNVNALYRQRIEHYFPASAAWVTIRPGEQSKSLEAYSLLVDELDGHIDRSSVVVALGGGVVGDLAGFIASTLLRGISWVQFPTTLLAMVDSSIGGKTAINSSKGKNRIGSFWSPERVYIASEFLSTLPTREVKCGLGELIKHAVLGDLGAFSQLELLAEEFNVLSLSPLLPKSCLFKSSIVETDEREEGIRAALNFGHTIGHALERALEFKLSHGECVAFGMIWELEMMQEYGGLSIESIQRVDRLINSLDMSTILSDDWNVDGFKSRFISSLHWDKKRTHDKIKQVIVPNIGEFYIENIPFQMIIDFCSYKLRSFQ